MSKSMERRIIKDKIRQFGAVRCIDKAIEEAKEQVEALEMLRAAIKLPSPALIDGAVRHVGQEHADTQITIYETLFRIWPEMRDAYLSKRKHAFDVQIPQAIIEYRDGVMSDEIAGDRD